VTNCGGSRWFSRETKRESREGFLGLYIGRRFLQEGLGLVRSDGGDGSRARGGHRPDVEETDGWVLPVSGERGRQRTPSGLKRYWAGAASTAGPIWSPWPFLPFLFLFPFSIF
jgi:hypothetical protein